MARTIRYHAVARTTEGRIGQLLVIREPGKSSRQEWTGVVYATQREADPDLEQLNKLDENGNTTAMRQVACMGTFHDRMARAFEAVGNGANARAARRLASRCRS